MFVPCFLLSLGSGHRFVLSSRLSWQIPLRVKSQSWGEGQQHNMQAKHRTGYLSDWTTLAFRCLFWKGCDSKRPKKSTQSFKPPNNKILLLISKILSLIAWKSNSAHNSRHHSYGVGQITHQSIFLSIKGLFITITPSTRNIDGCLSKHH